MRIVQGLVLSALTAGMVACSLKGVERGSTIVVRVEDRSEGKDAARPTLNGPIGPLATPTLPPPTVVSGFDCIGVNVVGPGIPDSSLNPSGNAQAMMPDLLAGRTYCSYRGIIAGPILANATTAQELAFVVPPGNPRLIQVVGFIERNGSHDCVREFVNGPQPSSSPGVRVEADVYEIGRQVVDLTHDTTVTISPDWNGLNSSVQLSRTLKCNDGNGASPTPSLPVVYPGPSLISARGDVAVYYDTRIAPSKIWVAGGGVASAEYLDLSAPTAWHAAGATAVASQAPILTGINTSALLLIGGSASPLNYQTYDGTTWATSMTGTGTFAYSSVVHHTNGDTYIFGGTNGSSQSSNNSKVTAGAAVPTPISTPLSMARSRSAATEMVNGTIAIVGGNTNSGSTAANACDTYQPSTTFVQVCAPYPILVQEGAMSPMTGGGVLYFGGLTPPSAFQGYVFASDSGISTWTVKSVMSIGRSQFKSFALPIVGKFIVIGGKVAVSGTMATATTEIYDLSTNVWTFGPNLMTARYGYGAVRVGNSIYIMGGYDSAGAPLSSVEILNL